MKVEGDYAGFLGINISKSTTIDRALELLQTGLIDRILAALNVNDDTTNVHTEPTEKKALGNEEGGPERKEIKVSICNRNATLLILQIKT